MATVQIPILFDVDNGSTTALELFGESASTDFFTHQVEFTVDGTTGSKLLAADLQSVHVGDSTDTDSEAIFFAKDANAVDRMCDKIANCLIQGTLTQANEASAKLVKGGGALDNYFTSDIGTGNMGAQLAKIACIHLVGHPLAQALFSNEQKIQDELLAQTTTTSTSAAVTDGFTNSAGTGVDYAAEKYHTRLSQQVATLLGGTAATNTLAIGSTDTTDANAVAKSTAKANTVLKSMFEQLMNVAGRSTSVAGAKEPAGEPTKTTTVSLPFASGDEIVVFVRAKIKLSVETAVMGDGTVKLVDSAGADLTSTQFITGNGSTAASLANAFPPTAGADKATGTVGKFNWMGAATNDTFGHATTDVTDTSTLDCHIMKITITV
tara:strand:- start:10097 stop:11236 length:1140 start_codon:yes stop_codon:yes gene_type:complete